MKEFKDNDDYLEAVRSTMQHVVDGNPEMGELEIRSYILAELEDMGIQWMGIEIIMDGLDYREEIK